MPELSAAQITADAIEILKAGGARVRKVHNVGAYKKRKNQVQKGWPDIQGYSSAGLIILCEVKTKTDTFYPEQLERLKDCRDCGGLAYVATEVRGQTVIYTYTEYILQ